MKTFKVILDETGCSVADELISIWLTVLNDAEKTSGFASEVDAEEVAHKLEEIAEARGDAEFPALMADPFHIPAFAVEEE